VSKGGSELFTGIVEEIGTVEGIAFAASSAQMTIRAKTVLSDVEVGHSISTNGVCLTVVRFTQETFTVDVMPETLRHTNFKSFRKGSPVNLERAMKVNDRFGGHIVSGHIDGVGTIRGIRQEGNATWMTVEPPDSLMKYIIQKGSIAMDGTSLTVAQLDNTTFSVSIIPVTKDETILLMKNVGDEINLECDLVGKYIERLLQFAPKSESKIDLNFLKENGFA
jgi:riboflavin synthase